MYVYMLCKFEYVVYRVYVDDRLIVYLCIV